MTALRDASARALDLVEFRADLNRQRLRMLELVARGGTDADRIEAEIRDKVKPIDERLARIAEFARSDSEFSSRVEEMTGTLKEYRRGRDAQLALIHQGKLEEAKQASLGEQEARFE